MTGQIVLVIEILFSNCLRDLAIVLSQNPYEKDSIDTAFQNLTKTIFNRFSLSSLKAHIRNALKFGHLLTVCAR